MQALVVSAVLHVGTQLLHRSCSAAGGYSLSMPIVYSLRRFLPACATFTSRRFLLACLVVEWSGILTITLCALGICLTITLCALGIWCQNLRGDRRRGRAKRSSPVCGAPATDHFTTIRGDQGP